MFGLSVRGFRVVLFFGIATALLLSAAGCESAADSEWKQVVPELEAPADGRQFDNYPRFAYLQWKPVDGVRRYLVEIEMGNESDGTWMPAPPGLNKMFVSENRTQINFVGAQPGRWRVFAINENNVRSQPSEWWHFEFSR